MMAQSRLLSIVSKFEEMLTDLREVEKNVSQLLKDATQLKKKSFGSRAKSDVTKNKINTENVQIILQETQNLDTRILKILYLLHRCNTLSFFIQRQMELRNYQNPTSPLYM